MSKDVFRKIIRGDKTVFERVFKEKFKSMVFYALNFGFSIDTSKEIVQYTFLKIWERKDSLSPHESFDNYLYAALRKNCLNELRKKKNKNQLFSEYTIEQIENNGDHNFDLNNRFFDLKMAYNNSLNAMPKQMRKVFTLSRDKKLKYREIAITLEISEKTVETHISRALKRLRQDLKEFLPVLLFILTSLALNLHCCYQ